MKSTFAVLACGVMVLSSTVVAAPPERTLPVDPVELVAGKTIEGKAEHSVEREGIAYRFATAANKAVFEKDPAKFEVVDGGACGRMGPLSGLGDARRYAVHQGRIYFFASDGCRAAFLKEPALHLETDDEKVFGTNEQVLQGRATLDRVVVWAGGAERVRGLKGYRAAAARKVKQGGKEWSVTNETAIVFPDKYFQKEAWNESWFSTVSGAEGGAMATSRGSERIAASRTRAFARAMARWPVVILKAYVDGSPKTDCPGLIVVGDGEGVAGGVPVEYVKVWLNGAASRLTVEKASGRLLELAYRGRDGTMKVGESVRRFTEFVTVEGVTLPTVYTVAFDGKELASAGAKIDVFEVNPQLAVDLFKVVKD